MLKGLDVPADSNLLVGLRTGDDAGVYRLSDDLALVQTVDFIGPVVDDPYLFGQIAAANSLSDVYAMGGRPITAMNVLLFPCRELPAGDVAAILAGGAEKIAEAGASLAGGHTVECPELFYGLSVTGTVDPARMTTNAGVSPGDLLVLTKPLGAGLVSTALKAGLARREDAEAMGLSMARLNRAAAEAAAKAGARAATDVTGFGLAGHALGMAKASGVDLRIDFKALPLLSGATEALANGLIPAGAHANAMQYREDVRNSRPEAEDELLILCDPQTSGGLLVAIAPANLSSLLDALGEAGVPASAIGEAVPGAGRIEVR